MTGCVQVFANRSGLSRFQGKLKLELQRGQFHHVARLLTVNNRSSVGRQLLSQTESSARGRRAKEEQTWETTFVVG
jgi:hypothetical protein